MLLRRGIRSSFSCYLIHVSNKVRVRLILEPHLDTLGC